MDKDGREQLGLSVKDADGVIEAELELTSGQAVNPLTRQFISKAHFTVVGDRLITIYPAELVGMPPITLSHVSRAAALEDILVKSLNEAILHVQRRSEQLSALGLTPRVDPSSLQLTAEVKPPGFTFTIGTDRLGNFRVTRAICDGVEMTTTSAHGFELSEFREKAALESYLIAMFSEGRPPPFPRSGTPPPKKRADAEVDTEPLSPSAPPVDPPLYFKDLVAAFGPAASVPGRSQIEVLIELKVGDEQYRFAAARVSGRTFRGLLAGAQGKLWADRFELQDFPGIKGLLAKLLGVPESRVEVL
ncbi:MAG: hypothetical protein JNK82_16250 [Myxococcaceae bacterium]|nr:hypothetical protein [Myxococcaceae bacterium]